MRNTALILLFAACTSAAIAQTPASPAPAKPATAAAKTTSAAKPAAKPAATSAKTVAPGEILPTGVAAIKGPKTTLFTVPLRYQDQKIGDGAEAVPGKLLKFHFTLWTAGTNGVKFDSSLDHPGAPLKDKDGKPVMGDDGKPKLADPQPISVIMGQGRPLPGWDMGCEGMKVGGTRRIFIPWQLGFGEHAIPAGPGSRPAVPAKSDLIVDVTLVDVAEAPAPPQRPAMGQGPHPPMGGPGAHPMPVAPPAPAAPAAAPAPAKPTAPAATPAPAPATPTQPQSK